ncbi:MAG: hypothetical protein NE327_00730 [Lentisphaeraceae bacterium]|nr:hypothetical protein [Lentisphaeraceae bacterium]
MGFIERTEKRLGKFAIGGLTMKLAVMQILFFLFYMLNLEEVRQGGQIFLDKTQVVDKVNLLNIGGSTIISDLVYIIASPAVLPTGPLSWIFMYFAIHLLIMFGTSLEELWGDYKYNLYVMTTVVFALLASQIFKLIYPVYSEYNLFYFSSVVYMAIFFSFATYFPNFKLLLFFILPTPVRFLAYLGAGGIILMMMGMNNFDRVFWGLGSFGSYILFHYHLAVNRQIQKARKNNFDKKLGKLNNQAFHKCNTCGKTENDDSTLEFRIADNGEEYCLEHIKEADKNS